SRPLYGRLATPPERAQLGSPSECGIRMPGAIDARKVSCSIDGPLGRITPDPYKRVLAAFENCGRLVGNSYLIGIMEGLSVTQEPGRQLRTQVQNVTFYQPLLIL